MSDLLKLVVVVNGGMAAFEHWLVVPDDWTPGEDWFVDKPLEKIVPLSRCLAVMAQARK